MNIKRTIRKKYSVKEASPVREYPKEIKNLIKGAIRRQLSERAHQLERDIKRYGPKNKIIDERTRNDVLFLESLLEDCRAKINNESYVSNIRNMVWSGTMEGYKFWLELASCNLNVVWNFYTYDEERKELVLSDSQFYNMYVPKIPHQEPIPPAPRRPEVPGGLDLD